MLRGALFCAAALFAVLCGCGGGVRAVSGPAPPGGAAPAKAPQACGGYRFAVKVAIDRTAAQINTSPQVTTVASMVALSAPSSPPPDARANSVEEQVYRIDDVVVGNIHQELDLDFHLLLRDSSGRTMIAEAPDPRCAMQSALAAQIQNVRAVLVNRYGTNPNLDPNIVVSVEGVGFFDYFHSQLGQARNGIELHPITAICFGMHCSLP